MSQHTRKVGLRRQLTVCAMMSALAMIVIFCFHKPPFATSLLAGLPLHYQVGIGLGFGCFYWIVTQIGYRFMPNSQTTRSTIESYSRLDLKGWNPVWISLAAGFGEELLFRGALQPLIGIWLTSIIFVVAHTKAYRFDALSKRVAIQMAGVFAVSCVLGLIASYVGLIAAMLVHALVDVIGLYAVRGAASKLQPLP